jgi:lycopene cyclase domain-containing protein
VQYWRYAFPAIMLSLGVYVLWDAAVTDRHWRFNTLYTLDFRLLKLPIEEWLFFITVPYACLFVKEVMTLFIGNSMKRELEWVRAGMFALIPVGIIVFRVGKEYTGLVLIALGAVAFLDRQLRTNIFLQTRTYWFMLAVVGFTFVFNMYLTARPVLIYDAAYQLDIRVITIPIEDFGYGLSHILLCTVLYEYMKLRTDTGQKGFV